MAVVGVGLIGGSVGLSLLESRLAERVVGVGRRTASLRAAKRRGAVTTTTVDLAKGVAEAELVVVCTPVGRIVDDVRQVARHGPPEAIITDVGSTKRLIVAALDELPTDGPRFIGSHPLAGGQRTGVAAAVAGLFRGRLTVVTPSPRSDEQALAKVARFWRSLGARVQEMSPDEHDRLVAASSHLPHLAAAALAEATAAEAWPLTATGFADTTRIAAGDPALWRQILTDNRANVLTALDAYETVLAAFRRALAENDDAALERLLAEAKRKRDALGS